MAVRKPHNFVTSQHRRRQSATRKMLARGEPQTPLLIGRKEYV